MKSSEAVKIAICLFLVFTLHSCKTKNGSAMSGVGASSEEDSGVVIRFRPVADKRQSQYLYDTETEINITQEVNGNEVRSTNQTAIKTFFDITKDSTGAYKLIISFRQFRAKMKTGDAESTFDASTAAKSLHVEERAFSPLLNTSFIAVVNPQGQVTSIKGINTIISRMHAAAQGDPNAMKQVESFTQQFLKADVLAKSIEENFKALPPRSIKVGESWTQNASIGSDVDLKYPVKNTLIDIKNNKAIIDVEGNINAENQSVRMQSYQITMSLEGTQKGKVYVDLSTGMVMRSESVTSTEGKMVMLGMEVPVNIYVTTKVKGTEVLPMSSK